MKLKISAKPLQFIFGRVAILYVLIPLILLSLPKWDVILAKAKIAALSRLTPDLAYYGFWAEYVTGKRKFNSQTIAEFENYDERAVRHPAEINWVDADALYKFEDYYDQLISYMPSRPDALAMMAYTHYLDGNIKKAIHYYEKAREWNVGFLWFNYNLGVLYYKQGEYQKAVEFFEQAVTTDPQGNMGFIYLSREFQFIASALKTDDIIQRKLQEAYRRCYQLIVLGYYRAKNFPQLLFGASQAIQSELLPKDFYLFYAGLAAYELKDYKVAVSLLQQCLQINPNYAEGFHYLGLSLKELGKEALANQALEKAKAFGLQKTFAQVLEENMEPEIF